VLNTNRMVHELRAQGYTGGKTILRDYLRPCCVFRRSRSAVTIHRDQ